jgi:hypothetical protein
MSYSAKLLAACLGYKKAHRSSENVAGSWRYRSRLEGQGASDCAGKDSYSSDAVSKDDILFLGQSQGVRNPNHNNSTNLRVSPARRQESNFRVRGLDQLEQHYSGVEQGQQVYGIPALGIILPVECRTRSTSWTLRHVEFKATVALYGT